MQRSTILAALAEPHRWGIMEALLVKPRNVGELVQWLRMPQYNVSKHLHTLRSAGLVRVERDRTRHVYHVAEGISREGGLDFGWATFRFDRESEPRGA